MAMKLTVVAGTFWQDFVGSHLLIEVYDSKKVNATSLHVKYKSSNNPN